MAHYVFMHDAICQRHIADEYWPGLRRGASAGSARQPRISPVPSGREKAASSCWSMRDGTQLLLQRRDDDRAQRVDRVARTSS
jgi:hypothetical protein